MGLREKEKSQPVLGALQTSRNRRVQKLKITAGGSPLHAKNCTAHSWPGSAVIDCELILFLGFVQKFRLEFFYIFVVLFKLLFIVASGDLDLNQNALC